MKPTVYLETTIIGYLAMRLSRDLRIAANQQSTRDWWDNHRHKYEPVISRFVSDECRTGDPTAVQDVWFTYEVCRSLKSPRRFKCWRKP